MSIKPIDFKITIPKLQEMSQIYQVKNNKPRNNAHILEVQQQQRITDESKKIIDTKETNNSKINNNKEKHNKNMKHTKEHKNKKVQKAKKNLKNNDIDGIGKKIDIKV